MGRIGSPAGTGCNSLPYNKKGGPVWAAQGKEGLKTVGKSALIR